MLIGVIGRKGSGKDTFAAELIHRNFYNIKMADGLKEMLRAFYRLIDLDHETIERKIEGDLKEMPCEDLVGATPRWAMQTLGTEWAKMVDPTHTIWARQWRDRVAPMLNSGTPVVCTDIRFLHEASIVTQLGGYLVRVERPSLEATDLHVSEQEMMLIEEDVTIQNTGTIEDLHAQARTLLEDLVK